MLSSSMSADEEDAVQRELAAMQAEQVCFLSHLFAKERADEW